MRSRAAMAWVALGCALLLLVALVIYGGWRGTLRGEALVEAMKPLAEGGPSDVKLAASAILRSYEETRRIASLWSGL